MIKLKDLLCELRQGERVEEDVKEFLTGNIITSGTALHFNTIIEDDLLDAAHMYFLGRGETSHSHGILTGIT